MVYIELYFYSHRKPEGSQIDMTQQMIGSSIESLNPVKKISVIKKLEISGLYLITNRISFSIQV
jgi:hypothetical protein